MRRLFLSFAAMLLTLQASAYTFSVDDIYYDLVGDEAYVTYATTDYNSYSGRITIPESVTYGGKTYAVTGIMAHAFENCSGLVSITIPQTVLRIGEQAFYNCRKITTLSLPDNLEVIEDRTFMFCESITSIHFPDKLKSIGNYAFAAGDWWATSSPQITSIVLPEGLETIGIYAFYVSPQLKSVTFPKSLKHIGEDAFYQCALMSLSFPEGSELKTIGDEAFGYNNMTYVSLPNSVTSIGTKAFQNCSKLRSFKFSGNCKSIGNSVLSECTSLIEVILPEGVSAISNRTFEGCSSLEELSLPSSLASIGTHAFHGTPLKELFIPDNVTTLAEKALAECSKLEKVTLSSSISSLEKYVFYGCSSLESINLHNGLTTIQDGAFEGCTSLKSISIPESVHSLGFHVFCGCTGLTSVSLPENLTKIPCGTFVGCTNLKDISFSSKLSDIGSNAFRGTGITGFIFPSTVTSIGGDPVYYVEHYNAGSTYDYSGGAFEDCSNLIAIELPENIISLGMSSFKGCSALRSVTLNRNLQSIGNEAFLGCVALQSIIIPNSVISIGDKAFQSCTSLQSFSFPDNVSVVSDYLFGNCSNLTQVSLSPNTTEIASGAFSCCNSLTAIDLPSTLTEIGSYAFEKTALLSVTLPKGVTILNQGTFQGCKSLVYVSLPEGLLKFEINDFWASHEGAFYECSSLREITIPEHVSSFSYRSDFLSCIGLRTLYYNAKSATSSASHEQPTFSNTSINKIVFGDKVSTIPNNVFNGLSSVTEIHSLNPVPPICDESVVFDGINRETCLVVVPAGSVEEYKQDNVWKTFKHIVSDEDFVTVSIASSNGEQGIVYGGGNCAKGETIILKATPMPGYKFDGWYDGETLIGSDAEMKYEVTDNASLTARFSIVYYQASVEYTGLGTVELTKTSVAHGEYTTLTAIPEDGQTLEKVTLNGKDITNLMINYCYTASVVAEDLKFVVIFAEVDNSENTLYMNAPRVTSGAKCMLPVSMINNKEVVAFQFDMVLPEGITLSKNEDEQTYKVAYNTERSKASHTVAASLLEDGTVRVVGYSSENDSYTGNDGVLVKVFVDVAEDVTDGGKTVQLKNIRLTTRDRKELVTTLKKYDLGVTEMPGDVTGDKNVSMADVVKTVNYILGIPMDNFNEGAADMNGDRQVTMIDVVEIVNLVLDGGSSQTRARRAPMVHAETFASLSISNDFTFVAGQATELNLALDNDDEYTAFQMDLKLPEGVRLAENGVEFTSRAKNSHVLGFREQEDGVIRIIGWSALNESFAGNTGDLLRLHLVSDIDTTVFTDPVTISDILFSTSTGLEKHLNDVSASGQTTGIHQIEGDVDSDCFDLLGRKVDVSSNGQMGQGIYINKGKKIIIK